MPLPGFGKQRNWCKRGPGQGETAILSPGRCGNRSRQPLKPADSETIGTCPSRILGVKQEPDTQTGGPEWTARRHKDRASRRRAGDTAGMRPLRRRPALLWESFPPVRRGHRVCVPTTAKAVAWTPKARPSLP